MSKESAPVEERRVGAAKDEGVSLRPTRNVVEEKRT